MTLTQTLFPYAALDHPRIQEDQAKAMCVETLPHCSQVKGRSTWNHAMHCPIGEWHVFHLLNVHKRFTRTP